MSLTDITWEEFDTYDKVGSPMPYDFRIHNGKYYTFEEFGIASVRRVLGTLIKEDGCFAKKFFLAIFLSSSVGGQ